ncbi:MAG TPA: hypothetical protein VFO01_12565 [Trebonia sp.]|nr:hypothetical protein [Trebonia sp.]
MFCRTCRGPAGAGYARCYQCDLALSQAGGLLADAVAPIGLAVRGGPLAGDLRRYKSDRAAGAPEAAERLEGSLAGFLRDKGDALWREAGMSAGPSAVAVVPSGQGRPGAHPLVSIVRSCVSLPLIRLSIVPGVIHVRGVDADWLRVTGSVAGADVLVVDDTWVSGGSAQSAAAALRLAGARRVAIVVLGRHVNPAHPPSARFLAALGDEGRRGNFL